MSDQTLTISGSRNEPILPFLGRRRFPFRTLIICFTAWLIATEVLVFDELKFYTNVEIVEQAARALRGPQIIVPSEPSNSSGAIKMENL
ncbi:MAG TPA: hypothetical protein VH229_08380 [Candidatus Udaeobacter sp.]|jgi:hypothetical protein|nr:hypothetical protein [Candidatus Udaeobacter sp.]